MPEKLIFYFSGKGIPASEVSQITEAFKFKKLRKEISLPKKAKTVGIVKFSKNYSCIKENLH